MKRTFGFLAVALVLGALFSGCYYHQEYDDNPTGPDGTGVQGYYLNVNCIPATVPANGSSGFTVQVWLRDIGTGEPIPGADVYLSLWQTDQSGAAIGTFSKDDAWFNNGATRILVTTGADGTARAPVHVGSAYYWTDSEKRGMVKAEITMEMDTRDPIFLTEYGYFMIYNPYL
jgi:hypothetical protein